MGLRFEADLELTSNGRRTTVTGDPDGHLVITAHELAPLVASLPGGAAPLGTLRTASARLADAGATVHLRTPSRALLTLGADARPQAVLRLARVPHVRIESVRGLAVAGRRRLLPVAAVALAAGALVIGGRRAR